MSSATIKPLSQPSATTSGELPSPRPDHARSRGVRAAATDRRTAPAPRTVCAAALRGRGSTIPSAQILVGQGSTSRIGASPPRNPYCDPSRPTRWCGADPSRAHLAPAEVTPDATCSKRLGFYLVAAWAAIVNFFLTAPHAGRSPTALFARFRTSSRQGDRRAARDVPASRARSGTSTSRTSHVLRGGMGVSIAILPRARVAGDRHRARLDAVLATARRSCSSFVIGSLLGVAAAWWRRG